jgi:hypothetical protein
MSMSQYKGMCPECRQWVKLCRLDASAVVKLKQDAKMSFLCGIHDPTPDAQTTEVVSQETGATLERYCNGALRPPLQVAALN